MMDLKPIGEAARKAALSLNKAKTDDKNAALLAAAGALLDSREEILRANEEDIRAAEASGMKESLIDRLRLTEERIDAMAEGLRQIVSLDDPIGEVLEMKKRPNGLLIGKMVVPLGVIGIIYESRPNVTVDAFGLCFKTGNAVILKGGSDALRSNTCIARILQSALVSSGFPAACVSLIEDTDRETVRALLHMNEYLDVIIPRGGAGLISMVVQNSTVPVIETGTGNCHVYVDESADLNMALDIIENAKTQRTGVCNACESVVVHQAVAEEFSKLLAARLSSKHVEIRADETARQYEDSFVPATEEDWGTEYLDLILSLKTVASLDEAIDHINKYNTKHSEAIITQNYTNAQRFLNEIDAAAVYVNASTRFTDGFEFGFGAEIGISTQKLHARGPMGLMQLTSTKYIIYGNGQVRK